MVRCLPLSRKSFILSNLFSLAEALGLNKSAYVPPHLRNLQRAASNPSFFNGQVLSLCPPCRCDLHVCNRAARGGFESRGGFSDRGRSAFSSSPRGGSSSSNWAGPHAPSNWNAPSAPPTRGGDSAPRESFGYGVWRDGKHIVGGRSARMEKEFFGDSADPSKQHTGINFEKYDDIPVEATGAGVPEPILSFTSPPLDSLLLENIGLAMYTTPTPVQKYSVPIVAGGRDLMACAQVSQYPFVSQICILLKFIVLSLSFVRRDPERLEAFSSLFYLHPFPKGLLHHPQINLSDKVMVVPVKLTPLR